MHMLIRVLVPVTDAAEAVDIEPSVSADRGERTYMITHQLITWDLDISPLEAEVILGALCPVVHDHVDVEPAGASFEDVVGAGDLKTDAGDAGEDE